MVKVIFVVCCYLKTYVAIASDDDDDDASNNPVYDHAQASTKSHCLVM